MYFILATVQEPETKEIINSFNDIIGIGGIIATILVGLITCLVTWKLTMKSIKQLKISYNIKIYPILSNSVTKDSEINLDDLKIQYKDKVLLNPCLLTLEIVNIGNESIANPPIKIKSSENIEVIPGYFEYVPNGYENLWHLKKLDKCSCSIQLEHINPKQVVKAFFFLDNLPQKKIIFECPMQNLQVQEVAYNNTSSQTSKQIKINPYFKSNIILIILTIVLFITIPQWEYYIDDFIWITGLHLQARFVVIFIMSVLMLAIIINSYGIPKIDEYIKNHPKYSFLIKTGLFIISLFLLIIITLDYIIVNFIPQVITAIIIVFLLSLFIHFSFLTKK